MNQYILHLETATTNCSVALSNKGELVNLIEKNEANFRHSDHLHLFLDQLMRDCKINYSDLSAIAVSKGPGSYTGLRIGVSTAKGLCYALNLPLIAVNTLEVLAEQIHPSPEDVLIPMLDARRDEVFTLVMDANRNVLSPTIAKIISSETFSNWAPKGNKILFGTGAEKCKKLINDNSIVYNDSVIVPSAKDMIKLVTKKLSINDFEDVAYFEPFYLKDFYSITKSNPA